MEIIKSDIMKDSKGKYYVRFQVTGAPGLFHMEVKPGNAPQLDKDLKDKREFEEAKKKAQEELKAKEAELQKLEARERRKLNEKLEKEFQEKRKSLRERLGLWIQVSPLLYIHSFLMNLNR